jgi:hypothetical protein
MRKIYLIGTLHAGWTPARELTEVLGRLQPTQILVELKNSAVRRKTKPAGPPEMIAALKWARAHRIAVAGFDAKYGVLKKGATRRDHLDALRSQEYWIRRSSWKAFSQLSNLKKLETPEFEALVDRERFRERQRRMLKNIRARMHSMGIVVIVTGCSHLPFLRRTIKGAGSFRAFK